MSKLDEVKAFIADNIEGADCGIFCTRNLCGDDMDTIYDKDGVTIDICYEYAYFEVFGLPRKDFDELELYYEDLKREYRRKLHEDTRLVI